MDEANLLKHAVALKIARSFSRLSDKGTSQQYKCILLAGFLIKQTTSRGELTAVSGQCSKERCSHSRWHSAPQYCVRVKVRFKCDQWHVYLSQNRHELPLHVLLPLHQLLVHGHLILQLTGLCLHVVLQNKHVNFLLLLLGPALLKSPHFNTCTALVNSSVT